MPEVVARYDYVDEQGALIFQVERLKPKGFRQRRPDENGGWTYHLDGARRVLYGLPTVREAVQSGQWILLVEGEKDVHTLRDAGHVATTSPGGAGKWRPEYAESLAGAKVAVIADADDPGRRHALEVACSLDRVVDKLMIYEPAPPHKDVTKHLKAGLSMKDLRPFDRAAAQAKLMPEGARRRAGVISARDFCARPGMNGSAQVLGPMLWREMRMCLGSDTGHGKTTLGLQMIRAVVEREQFLDWTGAGGRALVVDVEQGELTVQDRLRDLGLEQSDNVDLLWEPNGLMLDQSPEDVRHVESILREGRYDVVLLDPLYQLHCGDESSERTAADVMRMIDGWARRWKFAVIIPMHRRKPLAQAGKTRFTIHEIGGHGAWVRNAEIVLGLNRPWPGRGSLHFFKDRPGRLAGIGTVWQLGFDAESHRYSRVTEDNEGGWRRTKLWLAQANDPPTTGELAEIFNVTTATIQAHMRKIGAHHDDANGDDRRWALEPFPTAQAELELSG